MIRQRFDPEKALEVILYITTQVHDMYNALKVLYFADKDHLARYGRLICGDSYVAMKHGPVPSGVYDIVKFARGDGYCWIDLPIRQALSVEENNITPHREANADFLSDSDIECLDRSIEKYGQMGFRQLKRLSHRDEPFKSVGRNDFIPLEKIVHDLPDGARLLEHLRN